MFPERFGILVLHVKRGWSIEMASKRRHVLEHFRHIDRRAERKDIAMGAISEKKEHGAKHAASDRSALSIKKLEDVMMEGCVFQ
jgi:hypothetical protein